MQDTQMQTTNQPQKINPIVWGGLLIVAGVLLLLQNIGLFGSVMSTIWVLVFAAGGAVFLYGFFSRRENMWWAAIPGCTLFGLAGAILMSDIMPASMEFLSGPLFLGSIGLGFVLIYFVRHDAWWAIIPASTMGTLAVVAATEGADLGLGELVSGSIFFVGLGLTFLVVALLPSETQQRRWAFIPSAVLLAMGFLVGTPFIASINYIWPVALIVGGGMLVWKALVTKQE